MRKEGVIGFDGVELVSDNGSHDMKECIAGQAMFGQIERRKSLDVADNCFSHIGLIQQHFVDHRDGQGFHVSTHAGEEGQTTIQQFPD
jgi:hypothetical protein